MKLVLLMPEHLPQNVAAVRRAPCPDGFTDVMERLDSHPTAGRLLTALADVPPRPNRAKLARHETLALHDRRERQHAVIDDYFGVLRVQGDAPEAFAHGLLLAYRVFLEDGVQCGTGLSPEHWSELAWSLEEALRFIAGRRPVPLRLRALPAGTAPSDPHRRWRVGHQIFFPIVQGIVVALNCAHAALLGGRHDLAAQGFRLATILMGGSACALRFAGDFPAGDYAKAVRPSMTPPFTPESLSGLMSRDHAAMVHLFGQLGVLSAHLPAALRELYDRFVASTESTYDAHRGICTRFDGDHVVSLRMSASSPVTAAGVLDQIKQARLRVLRSE
jgi:hypothetical protein